MEDYIKRAEHDEFSRRIDAEERRQNKRLDILEENSKQIGTLVVAIERMACNMESMSKEQKRQGEILDEQKEQIEKIEHEPGNTWKNIKQKAIDTAVGAIIGALTCGIVVILATYIK